MAKFRRLVVPGYPHHVTQRGVRRQQTFFEDADYRQYLDLAIAQRNRVDLEVWAYCLMPNHVHWVVVPETPDGLSRFFATLHKRYARYINDKAEWRGHLWQQRFYSVVMDDRHAIAAMRYVELNPVRARLVSSVRQWPWSSAGAHLGLRSDPLVDSHRGQQLVSNWHDYLGDCEVDELFDEIRHQTRTGRPAGNDIFIERLESLSGRQVRPKRRGRKPKIGN